MVIFNIKFQRVGKYQCFIFVTGGGMICTRCLMHNFAPPKIQLGTWYSNWYSHLLVHNDLKQLPMTVTVQCTVYIHVNYSIFSLPAMLMWLLKHKFTKLI